jgi:hypothetical protein
MARPLYEIAKDIQRDWATPSIHATPYINAMRDLGHVKESYGADDGTSIVLYFLCNAQGWRGPVAKRVKAELKALVAEAK